MQGQLHEDSITVDHEEALNRIAYDLFNEMYTLCAKSARYGQKSIKIMLCDLPTHRWIPGGSSEEHVKTRLLKLIRSEHLLKSCTPGGLYELSWEKEPDRIPVLRASDLIEAGYPIDEERFGTILKALKRAILEGHVPGRTLQAELLWIKSAFPI